MTEYNYDDPIAITEDIFWIGFSDQAAKVRCNPFHA